ncbi:Uncharacterized protein dnm_042100 [Desulfonema magnum]|uniref:Uncharacterized protein n=1 Tax=Desulfonema magnum TaxID=45655 RepID=A0A975GNV3_9BACT|nr:Uncharacterized protein dnm_042100 [Desulfonema magnum]
MLTCISNYLTISFRYSHGKETRVFPRNDPPPLKKKSRVSPLFAEKKMYKKFLIITDLGEAGNMTTDSGDETDSTGRYDSGSPKGVSDPESLIPAGSP